MRLQGQSNDFIDGSEAISKQTQMLYDTTKAEPPKTNPVDNTDDELAPSGTTTTFDIRGEQQEARVAAYLQAKSDGKTEEQAQNISAAVGNNVGAAALARIKF